MDEITFGYCLPLFANPSATLFRTPNLERIDARETLELGRHAERLGFDALWVADHLMLGHDEAILEGWTMLSALAAVTRRARLGMIHQGHFFREPGLVAKMAATLDQLSGGRFIVFYDPGHQRREHLAYRLPYPDDLDHRVADTIDGLRLILDLWRGDASTTVTHGAYGVTGAACRPTPAQRPHPPLWFGETHPGMLAICATMGQGWNTTPCGIDEFGRRVELVRAACAGAGRNPDDIEVSVELQVLIAAEDEVGPRLRAILDKAPDAEAIEPDIVAFAHGRTARLPASLTDSTLIGTANQIRAQLHPYVDRGARHFLLWFLDAPDRTGMELFARDVAPWISEQSAPSKPR